MDEGLKMPTDRKAFDMPPPPPADVTAIVEYVEAPPEIPDVNDVNKWLEDLGGGFQAVQELKEQQETISETITALNEPVPGEYRDTAREMTDVPKAEETQEWLGEVNPNFDPYDWESPYNNNCGSCALVVEQRLDGDADSVATANNIGTIQEMNAITGMEQVAMSPEQIKDYLMAQGPGSHGIVGIDRAEGPGHWFNAYYDGEKVVAIDGQSGEIRGWPPDYGDVVRWDLSIQQAA